MSDCLLDGAQCTPITGQQCCGSSVCSIDTSLPTLGQVSFITVCISAGGSLLDGVLSAPPGSTVTLASPNSVSGALLPRQGPAAPARLLTLLLPLLTPATSPASPVLAASGTAPLTSSSCANVPSDACTTGGSNDCCAGDVCGQSGCETDVGGASTPSAVAPAPTAAGPSQTPPPLAPAPLQNSLPDVLLTTEPASETSGSGAPSDTAPAAAMHADVPADAACHNEPTWPCTLPGGSNDCCGLELCGQSGCEVQPDVGGAGAPAQQNPYVYNPAAAAAARLAAAACTNDPSKACTGWTTPGPNDCCTGFRCSQTGCVPDGSVILPPQTADGHSIYFYAGPVSTEVR